MKAGFGSFWGILHMNTIRFFLFMGAIAVLVSGCAHVDERVATGWTVPLAQLGIDGSVDLSTDLGGTPGAGP